MDLSLPVARQSLSGVIERPLKIAHIVESLEVGGAETLVAELSRIYCQWGHAVTIHCLFQRGALSSDLEKDGIDIVVHGSSSRWGNTMSLYRRFRKDRPDIVHCHNGEATVVTLPAAKLARARAIISTRHGIANPPKTWKIFRSRWRFWLAAPFCDRIVAVCETAQRNMRWGPMRLLNNIALVRNGASPARQASDDDALIAKQGLTLIHVSRLHKFKDQETLLRAVALASRRVSDLYLWMIGDGPEAETLHRLSAELGLQDRVFFLGTRFDVGGWLSRADLFVLSSRTEGLPVSLLEAMAAGLPFVVTKVGGMPEVAEMSAAGVVVDPDNPEALADALIDASARREELPEWGRRARECYENHFTLETMARNYVSLYRQCLAERRRA